MVSWSTLQLQQICYFQRLVNLNPELIHLNLLLLGLVIILSDNNTTDCSVEHWSDCHLAVSKYLFLHLQ